MLEPHAPEERSITESPPPRLMRPSRPAVPALEGLVRRTAHETVLDTLRKAILGGTIEAGTPLVQAELSTLLGVSKTPIREAIRDLAAEGLIDFDSYRSSVVHTPTLEEARDIYELRLTIEAIAVRKSIAAISDGEIDRADELRVSMEHTTDVGEWVELNRQFHDVLTGAGASRRLLAIITSLRNAAALQVAWSLKGQPPRMTRANEDHARLVEAYRRRDAEAAVAVAEQHLRSTLDAIEEFERGRDNDRSAG